MFPAFSLLLEEILVGLHRLAQQPMPPASANSNQFGNFREEVRQVLGINGNLMSTAIMTRFGFGRTNQRGGWMVTFYTGIRQNVAGIAQH